MNVESQPNPVTAVKRLTDRFTDDRKPGQVVGSRSQNGVLRRGVDKENCLSIDNGALRIRPLHQAGWRRAGLSYEPYRRQPGLAFVVYMLNGHNTSQCGGLGESLRSRLSRWWVGSETYSRKERIVQWLASRRITRAFRQFLWWYHLDAYSHSLPSLDENLAVGWFSKEVPKNPLVEGDAFIMHATGPENGELWATIGENPLPAIRGVQDLQIYYVVVLRGKGAAFYAASVPDANGLSAFPEMRPLAIDPFDTTELLYPGIHQSVLGQIGFRLDTRVYGACVEQVDELADWYSSAHAADSLKGAGVLHGSAAAVGGNWQVKEGWFERHRDGAESVDGSSVAILDPGAPSGLIHVLCQPDTEGVGAGGIIWRFQDPGNYWRLLVGEKGCQLSILENGEWTELAASEVPRLLPGVPNSIQLLDDGDRMSFHLGGELLFGTRFRDPRLRTATGVGLYSSGSTLSYQSFEAHPWAIPLPEGLRMGEPWMRKGATVVVADDFTGAPGDLEGHATKAGRKTWRRQIGAGKLELTGNGAAKIKASAKQPNPGRTAYMIDWDSPDFADISVQITPPGTGPDQGEHGLCGFIVWQDPDNYITINIWVNHFYGGASISCFFHLNGFEDLYDAIWSNVGKRVYYGVPLTLRLVFDGMNYSVFVNEEPVLYRALTDVYPDYGQFTINQVGLMANWEWGNDTGSIFQNFVGMV